MSIHKLYTNKLSFTKVWHTFVKSILVLLGLYLSGCASRCQPEGSTITSLVNEKGFRLVYTNNPNITLNNYTTLVIQFNNSFGGTLKKLQDNVLFNAYTLRYNINSQTKRLTIEFTAVNGGSTEGTNMGGGSTGDPTVVPYQYNTNTRLYLQEVNGPYTYEFVAYQGVIDPTNTLTQNCTFR